ncbi:MAG TPA: ABC transporter permease [Chloroflexota bacterium]
MRRYLLRRALQSFVLLWVVSAIFFAGLRLAPGGPEMMVADPRLTPADRAAMRAEWGLDDPLQIQYLRWMTHLLQGDLGRSFQDRRPVLDKILERAPNTLYLNAAALLVSLVGIPLGVWAATNRGRLPDHAVRVATTVVNAMPDWWLGLMLLVLLGASLELLPLGGMYTIGNDTLPDRLWHLALPALIGATGGVIGFARVIRAQLLEELSQDYVRTARAKGLRERTVRYRHALRNSLIPIATGVGPAITGLVGGSVLYERVFSWPGIGRLGYDAALQRDFPLAMGLFFIFTVLILVGYLISDVAYVVVDPRVQIE